MYKLLIHDLWFAMTSNYHFASQKDFLPVKPITRPSREYFQTISLCYFGIHMDKTNLNNFLFQI